MINNKNNTWNNFKLKMKKRTSTGNLLHFLLLYHTIALLMILLWIY